MLSGRLAVELPNRLRRLRVLDLGGNILRGRLPGTLRDLESAAEKVDLSGNLFDGRLPLGLACCQRLTYLDVSGNKWTPDEVAELGKFLRARLHTAAPNVFV